MKHQTKKDLFFMVMWAGMIANYWLVGYTFMNIFKYGKVEYTEPNQFILWTEIFMFLILGYMMFVNVMEYFFNKHNEVRRLKKDET